MNKTLYILRSVSGAGKTTLAKELEDTLEDCISVAADDFHYDEEGRYNWKPENIHAAHKWCQAEVDRYMYKYAYKNIIVHNTNTTEKEIKPYIDLADQYGYKVVSLVVENRHGNNDVHYVPEDVKKKQEQRLRGSLKLI